MGEKKFCPFCPKILKLQNKVKPLYEDERHEEKNGTAKQMFHLVSVHFDMERTGDNGK